MKKRQILFNGEMVRAILSGKKTQTRRVVKPQPCSDLVIPEEGFIYCLENGICAGRQRILVGENPDNPQDDVEWIFFPQVCPYGGPGNQLWAREAGALHVPPTASRFTLKIEQIRAQKLQDISEEDAKAEGVNASFGFRDGKQLQVYRDQFVCLWDSLSAKRGYSWASNPWVWAITFNRV